MATEVTDNMMSHYDTEFHVSPYFFSDTAYSRSFMKSLIGLRQNSTFTDIILKVDDRMLPCHKVVLSAASPYFLAMFSSGLEESTSDSVEIKGTDAETLTTIVDFIYTSDIKITTNNVQNLIQACELFDFIGLKQACERFMIQQVDATNCIGLYKFSRLYGLRMLRESSRRCMLTMFKQIVLGNEFKEMIATELIEYITDDQLDVRTEDSVFEGVLIWVQHSIDDRRSEVENVFSCIRFPFCSSTYLCHVVDKSSLVNESQTCKQYIDEARLYHMLPEQRHEMKCSRVVPRQSFGTIRQLILMGGLTKDEKENRYCWYLKEDSGSWDLLAQLPKPNWKFYSVCVVPNGILVSGGYHGNVKRDCWCFETVEKKWKPWVAMIDVRCKHRSLMHGNCVYVVGGEDDFDRPVNSIERMELKAKHWDPVPPMDKALSDPLVVGLGRYIFVFGGIERDDATSTSTLAFDTVWDSWSSRSDMPEPCRLGSAASVNNQIYILAGYSRTCLCYDPSCDQWTKMIRPREKHGNAPAVVWNGNILVGGGDVDMNETTSVVEEYDPDKNEWSFWKMSLKEELSCHSMLNMELIGL